ncbi:MAG: carboxypeptidase regulatory-like domain-containing protein [Candidatus Cloacimonetes bacterium]|nr:carboxypeptidase regulatory-like domain-containing protein [Candidatus Cloacimonadota bacterium]
MLRRYFLFSFILLLMLPLFAKSNEIYFKFRINSQAEINKISRLISIDNIKGNVVYAYANQEELLAFNKLGYQFTALHQQNRSYQPKMAFDRSEMRDWESYPSYETYVDIMYQFAIDHPDICTVTSIGHTVEGRDILVARITDNPQQEEDEPEFFYTGQMHGDELVSFVLLLHLIDYLLSNYGTDTRVTNIVDNIDIQINPLSNPDGTYAGGNHTIWDATRYNANSVDLNRNFPDPEDGPHPDGYDWQPENIIMMNFADNNSFVMSSNFHSGAEVLNYPWDTWPRLSADDEWWQEVCHTYADTVHLHAPTNYMNGFDNGITNGFQWYTISGGRQDYMNYFHNCREMTLELSDDKFLPENELLPHWEYNRQSLLLYMEECLYGLRGIVTNNQIEPLAAKIKVLDHDNDNSEVYTDPEVGDYHRLLAPGTYSVKYDAYGYLPQTIENIEITDNNAAIQNVQLEAAPSYTISGVVRNALTNELIENAVLELIDTPIEPAVTDENGAYEIPGVYEDSYTIQVLAEGYSSLSQEILVNDQNTIFDFELYECETEDFETGDFTSYAWQFSGDTDWEIDNSTAYDGNYAAKSGDVGINQFTELTISLETTFAGQLSFFKKVSSELGYDFLEFSIDGTTLDSWSGEIDWEYNAYFIEAGVHTFSWKYTKDNSVSSGDDCGWVDHISFPPTVVVSANDNLLPVKVKLFDNYPNPFNPETIIKYQLIKREKISLNIYNVKGQLVRKLINNEEDAGIHSTIWKGKDDNGNQVSSGIYFYRMSAGENISTKKMLLLK